ncbi:tudor domain-containing protein 7-like isoform X3 [Myzus persicae]|uniref:tudor domain-containing protein 7-like isoform X3 n=1 Tax=Myzus persicae TaxID=13164 RepID=UPI000B935761|nr:tudor domain-containing protein 7-like isoform X3 [Myzus persicae]
MDDLDSVILNLKACLISTKGGIQLSQIENEYFKVTGERIPFRQLGFSSLETLLQSSGKFIIKNNGGGAIVQALATSKTQHLTELIKKQKSKPPKKKPFTGFKNAPRKIVSSNTYNGYARPNNYSRQGNNGSNYGPPRNNYQGTSVPNYTNNSQNKTQSSYSDNRPIRFNNYEPKTFDQNNYKKPHYPMDNYSNNTRNYNGNVQLKSDVCLPETKLDKFRIGDTDNINNKDTITTKNHMNMQENNGEFKKSSHQHKPIQKLPSIQNMPIKISTAQSRLEKYPKKCEQQITVDVESKSNSERPCAAATDLRNEVEDPIHEVFEEDKDYINELETYLKNLNLSEPYYEYMVKKEKSGKILKLTHICTIKVNEKSVGSSFPVDCTTNDYAQKVAAKHALTILKKQYGESVIYPITNDINTMASCVKKLLKQGHETTGIMGHVLERIYKEEFHENLPDNWDQLLGVFNYFTFDKLAANKVVIYLNETENNQQNGHEYTNKDFAEEQNFVPGTPLLFEDYSEKSVLVSANYGSTNVWIRLVGQSADENFIQMQAKFNDTMNTAGLSIPDQVIEGEFYAVLYNSSWHRVQISYVNNDDGTATCFMIDTGEQLNIAKDQICYLEPIFMKPKTQAIECILTQLDNFGTFDGLKELLDEMILNKTFFVVPDSLEEGCARVTLYEKGRVNVNDMIIQRFLERTTTKLPLFEDQAIVDGNVSSIVESGHLYLQLNIDIVTSLEEILPNDEFLDPEFFFKSKEDIMKDKVYITKYEADNIWSRVQVLDTINDSEAKIIYIDYGNIAQCEITKLANLELYDPLLAKIAPQAIKVSMNFLPPNTMTPDIANKIFTIIGNGTVLVNTVNAPNDDVPCVQLYKTEPDSPHIPYCINIPLYQSLKKQ